MSPWYVWVVGHWTAEDNWSLVGVFSSAEKAREAGFSGCFIAILPFDERIRADGDEMSVEWVE